MLPLMDSWLWDEAADILHRLRQNLPLAIATTIVISVLVAFWKRLVLFAKRRLGFVEPQKELCRPSLPEGEIARLYTLDKFRNGFSVPLGWRGALFDVGVVQRELGPGRWRRRAVAKMIVRFALGNNARVILWRDKEFPAVLFLKEIFASDHQAMQLEIHTVLRLNPRFLQSSLEETMQPPEQIAERICERISLPARQWASSLEGVEAYRRRDRLPEWSEAAKDWILSALQGTALELVRVSDLRLFSPALDRIYREYGELAVENEAARKEIERNKVRGALRQAILAGKLEEMRDRDQYEDAVRAIEQERSLKEKALRQELAQAELNELGEKLRLWKRKHDVLLQALDPVAGDSQTAIETGRHLAESLSQSAVEAADSPFSAHEREQIRAVLQSSRAREAKPVEILSAIFNGAAIPCAVFDPLARIRGMHTLHVGDGWRIFDGGSLWQIRLMRIGTRRHGFMWHRESPSLAQFETRESPDNRRFEQLIRLEEQFRLKVGPHEIPVQYLGGTPSRISLRIPEFQSGTPLSS